MYVEDKAKNADKYNKLDIIKATCFALLVIIAFIFIQAGIMVLCESVSLALFHESMAETDDGMVMISIIFGAVSAVIAAVLYKLINKRPQNDMLMKKCEITNLKRVAVILLFGIIVQWSMSAVLNFVYSFARETAVFKDYIDLMDTLDGSNSFYMYFYTFLFAPLSEEYIFRGVIYSYLRKHAPMNIANIIQAALFGLYHMNLIQGVYAFLGGLVFGYVAEHKKSMLELVLFHMVVNISGVFIFSYMYTFLENIINPFILYGLNSVITIVILLVLIKKKLLQNDKNGVENL